MSCPGGKYEPFRRNELLTQPRGLVGRGVRVTRSDRFRSYPARASQKETDFPFHDHELDLVDQYDIVAQTPRLHLTPEHGRIREEPQERTA